ncbi:MAG: peptidoglycan-binding protein [Phyllobacteriaceae bacterium]|nr:peptidoglycan-binding protein [Phyllobacteriaceae bacterium]
MDHGSDRGRGMVLSIALVLAGIVPAFAQTPPKRPAAPAPAATAPAPELGEIAPEAREAARLAWEGRPEAERKAIQSGLVWSGDYAGTLDGTFGRMTLEAIRAFQARSQTVPDGIPTDDVLTRLARVEKEKKAAVGFTIVDDPATGVRLGLPLKLVGKAAKAEGGTRWASKDGRVEWRAYALPRQDLTALYDRLKREGPGHKVGYAVMRADWFVIADTVGAKRGYQRFERVGDGVRGFIVYVDATADPILDRVVIASAAAFRSQPGKEPEPVATLPETKPAAATPTTPPATPPAPATVALASTGLVVAPGRAVVVAAAVDGCRVLTVSAKPATVAGLDDGKALALLSWSDTAAVPAIRLAEAAPPVGANETVVARTANARTVAAGTATERGVRAALQAGGLSAPVVDAEGRLVGLVAAAPDVAHAFAGVVPAADYPLVPGEVLARFVGKAGGGIEPAGASAPTTSAGAVARLGDRVVAVTCEK